MLSFREKRAAFEAKAQLEAERAEAEKKKTFDRSRSRKTAVDVATGTTISQDTLADAELARRDAKLYANQNKLCCLPVFGQTQDPQVLKRLREEEEATQALLAQYAEEDAKVRRQFQI